MWLSLTSKQRDVALTCLLLANHTDRTWEWGGEIQKVKRGEFITSLENLAKNCAKDVSIQNLRTSLKKLETWQFLTNESTRSGRKICIVNYSVYQDEEKKLTKELTNDQQTINKRLTTTKNDKNDKNEKKETLVVKTTTHPMVTFFTMKEEKHPAYEKFADEVGLKYKVPREKVLFEFEKFFNYWRQKNPSGKKELWQMQKVFDVKRRLNTWFSNIQDISTQSKPPIPTY